MYRSRILAALYFAITAQALTYWVSPECKEKNFDELAFNEVRNMGFEGSQKLKDKSNENMAYSFKQVFKVEKSDEAVVTKALTAFDTIAGMSLTSFEASDVRFYCDDDRTEGEGARWAVRKGDKKKPPESQWWIDKRNQILRKPGSKGCQDKDVDGTSFTLAETYKSLVNPDPLKDSHNPDRQTITMCDYGLNVKEGTARFLMDIKPDDNTIVLLAFSNFDGFLSVTLFHELCHLKKVLELPGGGGTEINGWQEVLDATAEEAVEAADSFALLGMLALAETYNMRLARPDSPDENERERAKMDGGGLVWIDPSKAPKGSNAKRTASISGAYFDPLANLKIGGRKMVKLSV